MSLPSITDSRAIVIRNNTVIFDETAIAKAEATASKISVRILMGERDEAVKLSILHARRAMVAEEAGHEALCRAEALERQLHSKKRTIDRITGDLDFERFRVIKATNEGYAAAKKACAKNAILKQQLVKFLDWVDEEVPIKVACTCPGRHAAYCMSD